MSQRNTETGTKERNKRKGVKNNETEWKIMAGKREIISFSLEKIL